jgi:hypothetical protein
VATPASPAASARDSTIPACYAFVIKGRIDGQKNADGDGYPLLSSFNAMHTDSPLRAALAHFYLGQVYEATGKRDPSVDKTIRRIVTDRRVIEGSPGHVRVRWFLRDPAAKPVVELFNGAYRVPVAGDATA